MRFVRRAVLGACLVLSPLAQAREVHHHHHPAVQGTRHRPAAHPKRRNTGIASWYAQGKRMANGKPFSRWRYTAASRTLPFGTKLRVTNLDTGRSTLVTITDRGPWIYSRILDLALRPARDIGCTGLCTVEYTVL